jgi:hypothetical protein
VRKAALLSLVLALVGAGSFALAASGGGAAAHGRPVDVSAAKLRTAQASSVHYSVVVAMTKAQEPLVLHISGGSSKEAMSVHLALTGGSTPPGTNSAIMVSKPFLYERAPGGVSVFGDVHWLRLSIDGKSPRSVVLSTVRSLTPSPLLRVIGEAKLRPLAARAGAFAGPVAYDDPVVRTALHALADGIEFRNLRVAVQVGRDGLIHHVGITGRTPDGKTTLNLRARLYAFGAPVRLVPPKPGTFMDQQLMQLGT